MILDFDTEHIRKHDISLLDCQVDLILRSLAFYKYTYEFVYPRRKENKSLEDPIPRTTYACELFVMTSPPTLILLLAIA